MTDSTQVTDGAQAPTDASPASTVTPGTLGDTPAASAPAAQQQTEPVVAASDASATPPKADDKPATKVVPEQYEDFKLPEGVQTDTEVATELKTIAKELGLSQDEAQKVNDVGVKAIQKLVTQQQEAFRKTQDTWVATAQTDKEFGGDAYKDSLKVAEKGLNTVGTPELFKLLNDSGLRKHPEIIRAFYRVGKSISDDRIVPAGQRNANQGGTDAAKVLYPNN